MEWQSGIGHQEGGPLGLAEIQPLWHLPIAVSFFSAISIQGHTGPCFCDPIVPKPMYEGAS